MHFCAWSCTSLGSISASPRCPISSNSRSRACASYPRLWLHFSKTIQESRSTSLLTTCLHWIRMYMMCEEKSSNRWESTLTEYSGTPLLPCVHGDIVVNTCSKMDVSKRKKCTMYSVVTTLKQALTSSLTQIRPVSIYKCKVHISIYFSSMCCHDS